jgi:hypothetical protein
VGQGGPGALAAAGRPADPAGDRKRKARWTENGRGAGAGRPAAGDVQLDAAAQEGRRAAFEAHSLSRHGQHGQCHREQAVDNKQQAEDGQQDTRGDPLVRKEVQRDMT